MESIFNFENVPLVNSLCDCNGSGGFRLVQVYQRKEARKTLWFTGILTGERLEEYEEKEEGDWKRS